LNVTFVDPNYPLEIPAICGGVTTNEKFLSRFMMSYTALSLLSPNRRVSLSYSCVDKQLVALRKVLSLRIHVLYWARPSHCRVNLFGLHFWCLMTISRTARVHILKVQRESPGTASRSLFNICKMFFPGWRCLTADWFSCLLLRRWSHSLSW
jgi:hypothetical protein